MKPLSPQITVQYSAAIFIRKQKNVCIRMHRLTSSEAPSGYRWNQNVVVFAPHT